MDFIIEQPRTSGMLEDAFGEDETRCRGSQFLLCALCTSTKILNTWAQAGIALRFYVCLFDPESMCMQRYWYSHISQLKPHCHSVSI